MAVSVLIRASVSVAQELLRDPFALLNGKPLSNALLSRNIQASL